MSITWGPARNELTILGEILLIGNGTADKLHDASLDIRELQKFINNAELWMMKAKELLRAYADQDAVVKMIERGEIAKQNLSSRQQILRVLNGKCLKKELTETCNELNRIDTKFGFLKLEIQTTLDALNERLSTFS